MNGAQVDLQDGDGWSALMRASWHGRCVKLLLENGAQIDLQDGKGYSALMHARRLGHNKVVSLLVEEGAQLGLKDDSEESVSTPPPLHRHVSDQEECKCDMIAMCGYEL